MGWILLLIYLAGVLGAGAGFWLSYDPRGFFWHIPRWKQTVVGGVFWPLIFLWLACVFFVAWLTDWRD